MNIDLLKEFGQREGIDYRILYAILMTESDGFGFDNHGKIKTRFEPHIYSGFSRVCLNQITKHPSLPGLDPKWIKQHNDSELLSMSTSFGIAQIMGWQYKLLGFTSVDCMVANYIESEENQIKSFLVFCLKYREGRFLKALKELNYRQIASMYNGAGFEKNRYDQKLIARFNSYKEVENIA